MNNKEVEKLDTLLRVLHVVEGELVQKEEAERSSSTAFERMRTYRILHAVLRARGVVRGLYEGEEDEDGMTEEWNV